MAICITDLNDILSRHDQIWFIVDLERLREEPQTWLWASKKAKIAGKVQSRFSIAD